MLSSGIYNGSCVLKMKNVTPSYAFQFVLKQLKMNGMLSFGPEVSMLKWPLLALGPHFSTILHVLLK